MLRTPNDNLIHEDTERFLSILDPEATSFTFQTFDDSGEGRKKLVRVLNGSFSQHAAALKIGRAHV